MNIDPQGSSWQSILAAARQGRRLFMASDADEVAAYAVFAREGRMKHRVQISLEGTQLAEYEPEALEGERGEDTLRRLQEDARWQVNDEHYVVTWDDLVLEDVFYIEDSQVPEPLAKRCSAAYGWAWCGTTETGAQVLFATIHGVETLLTFQHSLEDSTAQLSIAPLKAGAKVKVGKISTPMDALVMATGGHAWAQPRTTP